MYRGHTGHSLVFYRHKQEEESVDLKYDGASTWENVPSYMCTNKDSNQSAHPSSLIRVFVVRVKKRFLLGYQNTPCEDSDLTAKTQLI